MPARPARPWTRRWPRRGRAVIAEAAPARRPAGSLSVARSSLGPGLDGILVVAKPAGPTSHDIVALVRRLAATKRVGHGGTLDPFASGVLPVFLGHATRVVEYHLGDRKALSRDGLLRCVVVDRRPRGRADAGGRAGAHARGGRGGTPRADRHDLAATAGLQRDQGRRPARLRHGPCRRDGRAGRARGHDPRHRHRVVGRHATRCARSPSLDVDCSAGTYVRALARDLGETVGSAAYLGALTRTASRSVHARRRRLARRHPGGGRRRAGRPAAAAPAARHRPRRLPGRRR